MDINPEHTQGVRGKVMLDEHMKKVLSNRNTVKSTVPALPDIKQSFAIGYIVVCSEEKAHIFIMMDCSA